nr:MULTISPECIES: glutathione S-transferase family protein [unclassified Bradyrhizobium]
MIKLYGSLHSRALRNGWMLRELGLEWENVPTNFQDGSTRTPEFLAINPNGRVPALEDDGLRLCESLAINLYLARKYGGPLAPRTREEEALATQWSFWVIAEIEKPLLLAAANRVLFEPASARREAEVDIALGKLARPWGVLDAHLQKQAYLVNEDFTVADLNVASVMTLLPLAGIDIEAWPAMRRWLLECLERPAIADWKDVSFRIPRSETPLEMLRMFV